MLSSLLRPRKGRRRVDKSPFSSPFNGSPYQTRDAGDRDEESEEEQDQDPDNQEEVDPFAEQEQEDNDGDEDDLETPLLPIFSAAILDKLPLYNITHSIRILIIQKCETTLSWDQLRSPQVSQFLVKPIQSRIRAEHFNRATLCALLANCLQFKKESETNPGNTGVSKTRAMFTELLAMRLIKEYTTRELIDALSYDFDPLQGLSPFGTGANTPGLNASKQAQNQRTARISTVEIAIRATAKRFLAHPLVVQQLEAIWAGSIVFHSAADNLHRKPAKPHFPRGQGYGTMHEHSPTAMPADSVVSKKATTSQKVQHVVVSMTRRSVTLYDPRDASLFKLSRLRVPRYRQLFSTLSFIAMLGLFLAVLVDRSLHITPLEIVFWLWSAGYMLDEVVGFSEQGFGLYIMSVWNAFDLGILLLFVVYYVLRLYGVLIPDVNQRRIANMAYDVLASTAILLFPRAFSVLDHYRYFSQLLIAFRMMAQDLVAILILILISCSGFFVAFTLSFSDEKTYGTNVAYALFQILMGFTPAAWEVWPTYNILGKAVMTMFLIICHFLIVTILITVLTNSFMAIVQNANEEHQFLFAVNTISMVKSDALFSYVAPTNILSWLVSPLRFIIPFRQFVKFNRTIIKVTHFPILLSIFAYERVILSRIAYEPTDLIERRGPTSIKLPAFSLGKQPDLFSPGQRLREPSIISFHKSAALDEVFRRPFKGSTVRTTAQDMDGERRQSKNVVDNWMQEAENEGGASPPMEQPRSVLERLETRRPLFRRSHTADRAKPTKRDYSTATRSLVSDPEDRAQFELRRPLRIEEETDRELSTERLPEETDADGDDELLTTDEGDTQTIGRSSHVIETTPSPAEFDKENVPVSDESAEDYFNTPATAKRMSFPGPAAMSHAARARLMDSPDLLQPSSAISSKQPKGTAHGRNVSSTTVMFQPLADQLTSSSASELPVRKTSRPNTAHHTNSNGTSTPSQVVPGRRTPKPVLASRARPILPPRGVQQTAPNIHLGGFHFASQGNRSDAPISRARRDHRQPSFNAMALDLASEIGDNRYAQDVDVGGISGMPASFSEQLFRERELARERERRRKQSEDDDKAMVGRIMLARMNTLEEGFKDILGEIRHMRDDVVHSRVGSDAGSGGGVAGLLRGKERGTQLNLVIGAGGGSSTPSTVQGGGSAGGAGGPKTPALTRMGSERPRKSPRKLQRRSKGKEMETVAVPDSPNAEGVSPGHVETPTGEEQGVEGKEKRRSKTMKDLDNE